MDCMERINNAMDYIETHIMEEIDYNQVARRACCSVYEFQRLFSFFAEVPLSDYIRRRRLTLAAFELGDTGTRIIDVAARYGYKSPDAFSRAFKNLHGVTPTAARNEGTELKAYPRLSFCMFVDGDVEISYRIVYKHAHEVCGISTDVLRAHEQTNSTITRFWEDNIRKGVIGQFHRDIGLSDEICVNAALFNYRQSMFSYMICYEVPSHGSPNGYVVLSVPSFTWVVFTTPEHTSKETTRLVRRIRERIFQEWFPTSGYAHAGGPEFEIFKNENGRFIVEIWIPITKAIF